jgi:hypothetical protein
MGWENLRPEQDHDCGRGRPWLTFAKPGQTWRCTAKLGADKHRCGRLWEVYRAQDGAASGLLAWREVLEDGTPAPDSTYAARLASLGQVDVTREAVEHQLYGAHLGQNTEGKRSSQSVAELAVIQWTLDELERHGLAKWTHE